MSEMEKTIDFSKLGMPVFTGRPRGEKTRARIGMDEWSIDTRAKVSIPDGVYTVTSSYFLGLFGPTIRQLGSKEKFLEHYNFNAPDHIVEKLDGWITRALREKRDLFSHDGS